MAELAYALSVKQPWATLIIHAVKTVEVRRWSTRRRGRILIHAARIADPSPQAWELVPEELRAQANLAGGLIGACELTGCREYRTPAAFAADCTLHRNDPAWFRPPVLYGFEIAEPVVLPFREYPGWFRFFAVKEETPGRKRPPTRDADSG